MVFLKRWGVVLTGIVAGVYLAGAAHLYFGQDGHVFHPDREITATPETAGMVFERVALRASDGTRISAWYVPAPAARATVLYFHGNAQNLSAELGVIKMFRELGLSTLAVDYRGYGESEGKPSEAGLYLDSRAAWDWLTLEKKVPAASIVIWGRSLGAAVALELAADKQPGALVVEAAFTSLPDIGQQLYPYFPVKLLTRYRFDNLDRIGRVRSPVLVVHSVEDLLIPIAHGRRLYETASAPGKRFLEIRGPHKGLPYQRVYREGVESFISSLYAGASA